MASQINQDQQPNRETNNLPFGKNYLYTSLLLFVTFGKKMQLTHSFIFPQDVNSIFGCYCNHAFIKKKLEFFGGRNIDVKIEKSIDEIIIESSREVQAEPPGPLKKFATPWTKMIQKETWQGKLGGPYSGKMSIEIVGIPATIIGHMTLTSSDDGTVAKNITDIKCKVPFLGKAITKFIAQQSEEAIAQEFEYIKNHGNNFL